MFLDFYFIFLGFFCISRDFKDFFLKRCTGFFQNNLPLKSKIFVQYAIREEGSVLMGDSVTCDFSRQVHMGQQDSFNVNTTNSFNVNTTNSFNVNTTMSSGMMLKVQAQLHQQHQQQQQQQQQQQHQQQYHQHQLH